MATVRVRVAAHGKKMKKKDYYTTQGVWFVGTIFTNIIL
jgi:hypothetical protein